MRKIIFALMICLVGGMAFGAEATFMKAPELPSSVLAVVEWPNLATLQDHAEEFTNSIRPGSPVPPIVAVLTNVTMTTNPMVIVQTLPLRIVLVKDAAGNIGPVTVLNVTDTDAYMSNLLPMLQESGTSGDLKLFNLAGNPYVIGTKGKCAILGKTESAVNTVIETVASGALGAKPVVGGGDLAVLVNVKGLMEAGEGGLFDALREKVMSSMPFGQMGPQGAQTEAVLDAEMDACQALLAQINSFQTRLTLGADGAGLKIGMDAVPGTELATYLASVPQGLPDTLKYLPQDALIVVATRMGALAPLADAMADLQVKLMGVQGMATEDMTGMADVTKDALQAYGDEFCMAMCSGTGIRFVEVIRLKDRAAGETLIAKMGDVATQVTAAYKNMGLPMAMEFNPAAHTYREHEISEWTLSFGVTPAEGADPATAAMQAQQVAAMNAMFGGALKIDAALLENDWVLTVGTDALKSLKVIVDDTHAKLGDHAAFRRALAMVPENSEGLLYLRLPDMVKWAMSLGAKMGAPMPIDIARLQFADSPGIVAAFNVSGTQTVCDVNVPVAEIKSLMDGFMQIRQIMMQAQPTPPRGPRGMQKAAPRNQPRGRVRNPR